MIKAQLEELLESKIKRIEFLEKELETIDAKHIKELDEAYGTRAGYVSISERDYAHYERLQETTLQSVERADKLQEANTQLIKAIAELNGGVLKDLSQTIVNLTKKQERGY